MRAGELTFVVMGLADHDRLARSDAKPVPPARGGDSVAVGIVAFGLGFFVTGTALVAIVPAIAAASIPRAYFGRRRAAKMRELQIAWPDGLRDLGASIAAGRFASRGKVAISGALAI